MPCPMNGGVRWAASPSRKTPPVAPPVGELGAEGVLRDPHELQLLDRDVRGPRRDERVQAGDVAEVVGGLAGPEPELPAVAGSPDRACTSPARSGSQTWCTPSHWPRSAVVATSTTSQRCSNLQVAHRGADRGADDAVGAVAAQHVVGQQGLAPSPVTRSVTSTRTGPSPSWVTPVTSTPPRRVTVVRSEVGAQQLLPARAGRTCSPGGSRAGPGRCRGGTRPAPACSGRPAAARGRAGRSAANSSRDARAGPGCGRPRRRGGPPAAAGRPPSQRSSTRHSTPYWASRVAAVSPVGPAPMMTTGIRSWGRSRQDDEVGGDQ